MPAILKLTQFSRRKTKPEQNKTNKETKQSKTRHQIVKAESVPVRALVTTLENVNEVPGGSTAW